MKDDIKTPKIKLGKYRHYKGNFYQVVGSALHSETLEPLVIYKPLYDSEVEYWVRPYDMFVGKVEHNGNILPRFELTDEK